MSEEHLKLADEFFEANKGNQIFDLIFQRVKNGHTLSEPFEVVTGWEDKQCEQITYLMNIKLQSMNAGFRVKFLKESKDKKTNSV